MICVVYGTTGELIKLAPVLRRIRESGGEYLSATTGQQVQQIPALLEQLGLPQPDVWLAHGAGGRDLHANANVPGWLVDVGMTFGRSRAELSRRLRAGAGRPLLLVHGDTMTTVSGAAMGRLLRVSVAHVEAGLRSFDLLHPFPEELNRRVASRLAHLHYAPGPWAARNVRGDVVDTGTNTIRDSLELSPGATPSAEIDLPRGPFGLVSLHRFELLNNRALLTSTIDTLRRAAERIPLLFIDHPVTVAAVARFRLESFFDARLRRIPRLSFFSFVALLKRSVFLITDSGGSQEECFYLDHPCLVHRKRTERREGLGENVVLSRYDRGILEAFLDDPTRYRRRSRLPDTSPSHIIVSDLRRRGYLST